MRICNSCGTKTADEKPFCGSCGSGSFSNYCENCGNIFEAPFCPKCGVKAGKSAKKCPRCGTAYFTTACPDCGYTSINYNGAPRSSSVVGQQKSQVVPPMNPVQTQDKTTSSAQVHPAKAAPQTTEIYKKNNDNDIAKIGIIAGISGLFCIPTSIIAVVCGTIVKDRDSRGIAAQLLGCVGIAIKIIMYAVIEGVAK